MENNSEIEKTKRNNNDSSINKNKEPNGWKILLFCLLLFFGTVVFVSIVSSFLTNYS